MPTTGALIAFGFVALGMVLTPGPNMIYLISRSMCQGYRAGLISLAGVAVGFVVYMLLAAFGITAVVMAVPFAYDALRIAGALYLLYLAWTVVRPGGKSPFQVRDLPPDSSRQLFTMGLVTNLLNPKIAVMYLSLLPQFIDPENGPLLPQFLILGSAQIAISVTVNAAIVLSAGAVASFLARSPRWALFQRWLMATVLGALAFKMASDSRP